MSNVPRALFLLLFVSYAYFYQAGGWNQNTRFNLVRAILNDGTVQVDRYHANTGDKAFFDGHYYSDKAPGQAFGALPAVALTRVLYRSGGGNGESRDGLALLSYVATVSTVGLFTAFAGVVLYKLSTAWGASQGGALFAATAFGLATPMWALATLFIGHALAASCLVLAFAAACRIGHPPRHGAVPPGTTEPRSADLLQGLAIGGAAGWATISEFPAAVPAALIAVLAAIRAWPLGRRRAVRLLGGLTVGALLCASLLMAYQYACFGSPFHLAYSSEEGFEGMKQGLFGIQVPTREVLMELLFGTYRGLLPLAPLIAVTPAGLWMLRREGAAVATALVIAGFYILLNAGYYYWEGGWTMGPRHLAPAIPFLCLGLAPLWTRSSRAARLVLAALWIWGFSLSLITVSTMAQPAAAIRRPVAELVWPAFRDGDLALNTQTFDEARANRARWRTGQDPKAAWNLGMKLGLKGWASLLPLVLAWLVLAWHIGRTSPAPRRHTPC